MRRTFNLDPHKQVSFASSVGALIAHIVGSSVLFVVVAGIAWGLGAIVHYLHTVHPFAESILGIIQGVEYVLLVFDVVLCGYILVIGACRFCKEIWEGQ